MRRIALGLSAVLAMIGSFFALQRGGLDYDVFVHAARLVSESKQNALYLDSPDRYLYAPGFAWWMQPWISLPREMGLLLWSTLKGLVLLYLVWDLARLTRSWAWPLLSVLIWARSLLIEFQYGQINFFLMASAWFFWRKGAGLGVVAGALAAAKLVTLPVVLPSLFSGFKSWRKTAAFVLGGVLLLAPALFWETWPLHEQWFKALQLKGIPLDSHNQSLLATFLRLFSGEPVHVVAFGPGTVPFGWALLSVSTLQTLGSLVVVGVLAAVVGCAFKAARSGDEDESRMFWLSMLLALLILSSPIAWKPYFVFSIPLTALVLERLSRRSLPALWAWVGGFLLLINGTGIDVVGVWAGGYLEAAGVFFWAQVVLLATAFYLRPRL